MKPVDNTKIEPKKYYSDIILISISPEVALRNIVWPAIVEDQELALNETYPVSFVNFEGLPSVPEDTIVQLELEKAAKLTAIEPTAFPYKSTPSKTGWIKRLAPAVAFPLGWAMKDNLDKLPFVTVNAAMEHELYNPAAEALTKYDPT